MDKYSVRDAKDIQHSCFRLNSLQLRALLTGYLRADDEPRIPPVSAALTFPSNAVWISEREAAETFPLSRLRRRS